MDSIAGKLEGGESVVTQLIMGAGKTSVVAPLLALLMASPTCLNLQCMPHALLEMGRNVMREKFSAIVRRPVFTFNFNRFSKIDAALYQKIRKAREMRAIVIASPTAIKSFMLKHVEFMRHLEHEKNSTVKKGGFFRNFGLGAAQAMFNRKFNEVDATEVYYLKQTLEIFRTGILVIDEVDLVLHPLRSELNWPLGHKEVRAATVRSEIRRGKGARRSKLVANTVCSSQPLDFTKSRTLGPGVRWDAQWHLFDAFFSTKEDMTVEFKDSMQAINTLKRIKGTIEEGLRGKYLQGSPHLVLLSHSFYNRKVRVCERDLKRTRVNCEYPGESIHTSLSLSLSRR